MALKREWWQKTSTGVPVRVRILSPERMKRLKSNLRPGEELLGQAWVKELKYDGKRMYYRIYLNNGIKKAKPRLETYIHEVLHTEFPDLEEDRIQKLGKSMTGSILKFLKAHE